MEKCFCFLTFPCCDNLICLSEDLLYLTWASTLCQHFLCLHRHLSRDHVIRCRSIFLLHTSVPQRGHRTSVQHWSNRCNARGAFVIITWLDYNNMHDPLQTFDLPYPLSVCVAGMFSADIGCLEATAAASVDLTGPISSQRTVDVSMTPVCLDKHTAMF